MRLFATEFGIISDANYVHQSILSGISVGIESQVKQKHFQCLHDIVAITVSLTIVSRSSCHGLVAIEIILCVASLL